MLGQVLLLVEELLLPFAVVGPGAHEVAWDQAEGKLVRELGAELRRDEADDPLVDDLRVLLRVRTRLGVRVHREPKGLAAIPRRRGAEPVTVAASSLGVDRVEVSRVGLEPGQLHVVNP